MTAPPRAPEPGYTAPRTARMVPSTRTGLAQQEDVTADRPIPRGKTGRVLCFRPTRGKGTAVCGADLPRENPPIPSPRGHAPQEGGRRKREKTTNNKSTRKAIAKTT